MTKILHLENYESSGEIYQYLSDEFARIRKTHPAKRSIPLEWPGKPTLLALTNKSSGGYIYPSVVIKYVDNPRRHPVKLLEHVLIPSPTITSGNPFAELDALYQVILNPPDIDIPLMKRLLHLVIEITSLSELTAITGRAYDHDALAQGILSAPRLDDFLSLEKGTTEMTLCDLHSVLSITEDVHRPWIYFHHKSLEDYLCSPQRAGDLYQSQAHTHSDILTTSMLNLELWNGRWTLPDADFQDPDITVVYSCRFWKHFLIGEKCVPPSVLDFDARIAWRCCAVTRVQPPTKSVFDDFVDSFHNAMVSRIDQFWGWTTLIHVPFITQCKEEVECRVSCASFRRMVDYRRTVYDVAINDPNAPPMERLKIFEEKTRGLFAPLDLTPPTRVDATTLLDEASAPTPPSPPPRKALFGIGKFGRGGHSMPNPTPTAKRSRRSQKAGSDPQSAKRSRECIMM
jgi:hypothetical protein